MEIFLRIGAEIPKSSIFYHIFMLDFPPKKHHHWTMGCSPYGDQSPRADSVSANPAADVSTAKIFELPSGKRLQKAMGKITHHL